MYVGWDWASETHDITVMDADGGAVERWALRHDAAGIDAAIARLVTHGRPGELPVAIETTSGLVVDRLLAAGHPVVPIHPNAFNAARPRWGASRAKSAPVTASNWPTTCAPTATASGAWNPSTPPPPSSRP